MNYRKYLTDDILHFWLKYSLDKEQGGIFTQIDEFGKIISTDKSIWFIGRSLWTFAMAYNVIEPKEEYLDACETIYRFFSRCTAPDGRLPYLTTCDGNVLKQRDYYYSEAFAAIGCAQYYKACKRKDVAEVAIRYFNVVYSLYHNPEKKSPEYKSENPCDVFGLEMIMLSVAQFMRNSGIEDERFDILACEALEQMQSRGFVNDDERTVYEYLPLSGKTISKDKALYVCPGHIYEAAWFVLCEGEIKNNNKIRAFGKKLLDYALPAEEMIDLKIVKTGRYPREEDYIWWPQCEAIIAYRLAYQIFREDKYLKYANSIENFALSHFADTENGEWYTECTPDGNVRDTSKGTELKGPFHLPRMLFALISLEETGKIHKYVL